MPENFVFRQVCADVACDEVGVAPFGVTRSSSSVAKMSVAPPPSAQYASINDTIPSFIRLKYILKFEPSEVVEMDIKKAFADIEGKKTPQERLDALKAHLKAVQDAGKKPEAASKMRSAPVAKEQFERYITTLKSIQLTLEKVVNKRTIGNEETLLKTGFGAGKALSEQVNAALGSLM
jgi:hypothetical protein